MTNALNQLFTAPSSGKLDLTEFKLPWKISTFSEFCSIFGFTDSADIAPCFEKIKNYPVSAQWQNPKAYALIQQICQYDEFKAYLDGQSFNVPFLDQQTALDQWILWARHITQTYATEPTSQIFATARLLSIAPEGAHSQGHFTTFLSELKPLFPAHLQPILRDISLSSLCPSTQHPAVACFAQIYTNIQIDLSSETKEHLAHLLNFEASIAIPLLGQLFVRLESFPENQLIEALKQKKIELAHIFELIAALPSEAKIHFLLNISAACPTYHEKIFEQYGRQLPALTTHEQQTAQTQLKTADVPDSIKQDLATLAQASTSLADKEKQPLGKNKVKWIGRLITPIIFLEFSRAFFLSVFQRKEENHTYYRNRMKALRQLHHYRDPEALGRIEDTSLNFFINYLRPIVDPNPDLLYTFGRHLKTKATPPDMSYNNLLKSEVPFTSLKNTITMRIRSCF
jgi:hypothetical protein